jgi:hypothetical protein
MLRIGRLSVELGEAVDGIRARDNLIAQYKAEVERLEGVLEDTTEELMALQGSDEDEPVEDDDDLSCDCGCDDDDEDEVPVPNASDS